MALEKHLICIAASVPLDRVHVAVFCRQVLSGAAANQRPAGIPANPPKHSIHASALFAIVVAFRPRNAGDFFL